MIHSTEFSKCKQTYDVSYLRPECSLSLSLSLSLSISLLLSHLMYHLAAVVYLPYTYLASPIIKF